MMKTEQEQIEKMMLDVPQTIVAYDANPKGQHLYGEQRLQIAEILYDKGYGDVSEYKAEIERLKAEYEKLQELFAKYQLASDKEIRAQVKQAKIDILNFLKDGYEDDISTSNDCDMVVRVDDIDELIKEIEEQ